MKPASAQTERGFTLLELAIVLAIIGVITGMGLITLTANVQATQFNNTVTRMSTIETALLNFAVAYTRIPCPSDLTQTASSSTYGLEAGAGTGSAISTGTGACSGVGMLPQANFVATSGTAEGGVPTRALRLSDDYMYDGWGRRFRYAVDPTITVTGVLPVSAGGGCSDTSAITVNDSTGAARTTTGAYALISHGANGHGAYTSNGVPFDAGSTNTSEWANCCAHLPLAWYQPNNHPCQPSFVESAADRAMTSSGGPAPVTWVFRQEVADEGYQRCSDQSWLGGYHDMQRAPQTPGLQIRRAYLPDAGK